MIYPEDVGEVTRGGVGQFRRRDSAVDTDFSVARVQLQGVYRVAVILLIVHHQPGAIQCDIALLPT